MGDPRIAAQEAGHKAFLEAPCGLKDAVTAAINAAPDLPEQCETVAKLLKDAANQIRRVETERDAARESHAMQQRNTEAFFRENTRFRSDLAAARTRITALEQALRTCDEALARIEMRTMDDHPPFRVAPVEAFLPVIREARAAAKAALDE